MMTMIAHHAHRSGPTRRERAAKESSFEYLHNLRLNVQRDSHVENLIVC